MQIVRNISLRILLALTALSLTAGALAQYDGYRFSRLDINQGLSHNEVTCIFRDQKGFLWFGTMSGLNRYDGYAFKIFRHNLRDSSSINDDFIVQIWEGPAHRLWITTRAGLVIYDPLTETFGANAKQYLHSMHIDADSITDLRTDAAGNSWFLGTGTGAGLYKYDAAHSSVRHFTHLAGNEQSLHSNDISAFTPDTAGGWWLLCNDGTLDRMDASTGLITARYRTLVQQNPLGLAGCRIYADAANDCWIYQANKPGELIYYRPSAGMTRSIRKGLGKFALSTDLLTGIVQDDRGIIWIATDHGGINLLDKKDFSIHYLLSREDDDKTVSQNSINSLMKDRTGTIWCGTFKRGVSYYHEDILKFPLFRHQPSNPNSLGYDDVNRFVEDDKGNLWIGTNGGGLVYFDRQTGKFSRYTHNAANAASLSNDVIVSLCLDQAKRLWIGTYYGGLDMFDGRTFKHYRHNDADSNSISDDRVWEIRETTGGRLWIGTLAAGLDLFDPAKNQFRHFPPGSSDLSVHSGYISDLVRDRQGNLWIGTSAGIDVLEAATGKFRHYASKKGDPSSLSNNNVITIFEDSRGLIWAGTRDGLDLFDSSSGSFRTMRTEDGLPDNAILTILEDRDHHLWLGTPNGLSNVILTEDPRSGRYTCHFRNYDESHGLQGREFNENAALRTRAGELIFGGANGFNLFDPQKLHSVACSPRLVLTDLQVFNRSVGIGEKLNGHVLLPQSITESSQLTLHYNENVFSIGFAALDFLNAQKLKYSYMLEGFSKEWLVSDDKTRRAVFTNLDPGDYTFKVRTAPEDGPWSDHVLQMNIRILPPFWKTPLAYLVYAMLFVAALVLARQMILRRARLRFALEQEREEARRLHELDLMKIKFFTNVSHEFRTPLSLILTPLDKIIRNTDNPSQKAQLSLMHRNARRLLNMVNQLLDFRKLEVQELRLNATRGDVLQFIRDVSFSFTDMAEKKNIDFSYQAADSSLLTLFDHDKLERILFNLLSNAFKFTPEKGMIRMSVDILPAGERSGSGLPGISPTSTGLSGSSPSGTAPAGPRTLRIQVQDNGIGIAKDRLDKIFERFFQIDVPGSLVNQGSGIGLSITREFVKLHDGSILVDSTPGEGSCFTVLLPIPEIEAEQAPEVAPVPEPAPESQPLRVLPSSIGKAQPSDPAPAKKPVLLIVEDNEDFRFYLKDNLREYFTVLEAADGRQGWQKTLGAHPDLVVSDISMPEMNGIDLCRKIKEDRRTSFIPVILLTALIGEDQQLKGLETGANDYMTKPFNFEILLSKIRNLLAQQELSRKTWQKQVSASPAAVSIETSDEKFMRQALELVEKNMSNPDFSVEEMSRALYLSRVALYKKILALSGKTPIEFIRSLRLKRAAQLLTDSQATVAGIAYEVGFNNPKYFARYFKAEFGKLPSAFQKDSPQPLRDPG